MNSCGLYGRDVCERAYLQMCCIQASSSSKCPITPNFSLAKRRKIALQYYKPIYVKKYLKGPFIQIKSHLQLAPWDEDLKDVATASAIMLSNGRLRIEDGARPLTSPFVHTIHQSVHELQWEITYVSNGIIDATTVTKGLQRGLLLRMSISKIYAKLAKL